MAHQFVVNSAIFHRSLVHQPETVTSGNGIAIKTSAGRVVLDASSGPAVSCLGHSRPDIAAVIAEQINQIAYIYSGARFTSQAAEDLAAHLLADRPGGLSKAIFVNSGSEATDTAIKLVTQYWHEVGQPQRRYYISRKQSYHGNTLGALSVSGHASRRELYGDWLSDNVVFMDPCMPYRFKRKLESDEDYLQRLIDQLESEILHLGPGNVAAFVGETISGSTLGCAPAIKGYWKAIRAICDRHGILLVLRSQIMCGMGKTGTMHAWEQEDIRGPDVQMIGKALGGGFLPLSGVLAHEKVFEAVFKGSKGLAHGHTFQAHPAACASALAVQRAIRDEGVLENVQAMGVILERLLHDEIAPLPHVGDVRGRGLFCAVEFMHDKEAKVAMPQTAAFGAKVVEKALELGLNILGNLGETGEVFVDHVILSPPYVVCEAELKEIVRILAESIVAVGTEYQCTHSQANGFA